MTKIHGPALERLAEFRFQIRRFLKFSNRAARAAGLDPQQHQMLLVIAGTSKGEAASISHLANRMHLHHNTAVELVNRLESKKLARRVPSHKDRRQVGVSISPRGRQVLAKLTRHHLAELRAEGPALIRSLQAVIGRNPRGGAASGQTYRASGRSFAK